MSDTKYVLVAVRIQLFNPNNQAEVVEVNTLQDQLVIEAGSADPMPLSKWEPESLKALTARYENRVQETQQLERHDVSPRPG